MEINKLKWGEYLKLKGLSDKSIHDYNSYFDKLDFEKLSPDYLFTWLGKHNNMVSRAMLKNLLYFIKINKDFPNEIKEWVNYFEIPKRTGAKKERVLSIISKEQVHLLARSMPKPLYRFMVLLSFYLGLRSDELLKLTIHSFNWELEKVKVIGKRNKERILPLIPQLKTRLIDFINSEIEKNEEYFKLFDVSPRHWRRLVRGHSKKVLGFTISPHSLRHSCGSYLHAQGLDLKEIASFLGHSSINTTQIYVHLDKKTLNNKVINAFNG